MGNLRKKLGSYDVEEMHEMLPPPATKRGVVQRKFDRTSPHFYGYECWAERWMWVVVS